MNEKEKKEFYVSMCGCCLLAQAMKTCPACRFNIGLAKSQNPSEPGLVGIPVQLPVQFSTFALAGQA